MVKKNQKLRDSFWKKIFESEKILSDEEADNIENLIKLMRKELGFRI